MVLYKFILVEGRAFSQPEGLFDWDLLKLDWTAPKSINASTSTPCITFTYYALSGLFLSKGAFWAEPATLPLHFSLHTLWRLTSTSVRLVTAGVARMVLTAPDAHD